VSPPIRMQSCADLGEREIGEIWLAGKSLPRLLETPEVDARNS